MAKSDAPIYFVAALVGMAAGMLEIRVGDTLITSLFVLIATLVLGFIRPRRPWRWILIVGAGVPMVQLATYLVMGQRPYRAQIWESGFGFVTGMAGCYCGAFGRKAIEELFKS